MEKENNNKYNIKNKSIDILKDYFKYLSKNYLGVEIHSKNFKYSMVILFFYALFSSIGLSFIAGFSNFILIFSSILLFVAIFIVVAFVVGKYIMKNDYNIIKFLNKYSSFLIIAHLLAFIFMFMSIFTRGSVIITLFLLIIFYNVIAMFSTIINAKGKTYIAIKVSFFIAIVTIYYLLANILLPLFIK